MFKSMPVLTLNVRKEYLQLDRLHYAYRKHQWFYMEKRGLSIYCLYISGREWGSGDMGLDISFKKGKCSIDSIDWASFTLGVYMTRLNFLPYIHERYYQVRKLYPKPATGQKVETGNYSKSKISQQVVKTKKDCYQYDFDVSFLVN